MTGPKPSNPPKFTRLDRRSARAQDELGRPRYSERDWAGWVLTGDPD